MRVLIAVHGYPPTHSAGAERQAERMATWLNGHGHEVEVFAVEAVDALSFEANSSLQDGIVIHRIAYDVKAGDDLFRNLYDNPIVGNSIQTILKRKHFDVVHLVSGYLLGGQVIYAAKQMNIPVVVSLMEYWFMCTQINLVQPTGRLCSGPESDQKCMRCIMEDKRRFRWLAEKTPPLVDTFWEVAQHLPFADAAINTVEQRRIYLREALNEANRVICNSHYIIEKFAEFGFETDYFTYMRQGLVSSLRAQARDIRAPRQSGEPLRLGYSGQIKFHKGVDLLIDAVTDLIDQGQLIELDIWGSITETPAYVNKLKERSAAYPSIRWKGQYSGTEVEKVLDVLDVLVVPSRWYENSPNVILEAYAMKLPVIATNLGGMSELVEHEKTGLVFTLNDAHDLRNQIERLMTEPDLLNQLRANLPRVKTLDEEMHELTTIYSEVM